MTFGSRTAPKNRVNLISLRAGEPIVGAAEFRYDAPR